MTAAGQLALLVSLVGFGYAGFACTAGWRTGHRGLRCTGNMAALVAMVSLGVVTAILACALVAKDFRFAYVVQYTSRDLCWQYALSALWVGQAGSLLVWTGFLGLLAVVYRYWPRREAGPIREPVFGILNVYAFFLTAIMVFAADPMEPSLSVPRDGAGLGPSLQHPAMLLHPPIVFLGYAGWAIPFALATVALAFGGRVAVAESDRCPRSRFGAQFGRDAEWIKEARSWALFSWAVLGIGILLGAEWAYEELGWGGYWAWDPVENGSLIPWLTGTALIHTLMAWQAVGVFKKTALLLAVATFGLCNFATFLTRSGIFSSLHAFSQSPLGWMFLGLMVALSAAGVLLVFRRRSELAAERAVGSLLSRESLVLIATVALLLLAAVAFLGTSMGPLSNMVLGRKVVVGEPFYNNVLIPTGLALLVTTSMAPLTRWGSPPSSSQRKGLYVAAVGGLVAAFASACDMGRLMAVTTVGLAVTTLIALAVALLLDGRRRTSPVRWLDAARTLVSGRRRYAGFLIHLAFVSLAVGVAGSALGTHRCEVTMMQGETIEFAGRSVCFSQLIERQLPDRLIVEAQLDIEKGSTGFMLLPSQHLHLMQNDWISRVAIESTWAGDFYAILHNGREQGDVELTLIENPRMRWLWLSGYLAGLGAMIGLWPNRRRKSPVDGSAVPRATGILGTRHMAGRPRCRTRMPSVHGVDRS